MQTTEGGRGGSDSAGDHDGGVECVGENETVLDAARRLRDLDVGAMPICGEDNRLKGMLTDRDIVVKVLAEGKDPGQDGPAPGHALRLTGPRAGAGGGRPGVSVSSLAKPRSPAILWRGHAIPSRTLEARIDLVLVEMQTSGSRVVMFAPAGWRRPEGAPARALPAGLYGSAFGQLDIGNPSRTSIPEGRPRWRS